MTARPLLFALGLLATMGGPLVDAEIIVAPRAQQQPARAPSYPPPRARKSGKLARRIARNRGAR